MKAKTFIQISISFLFLALGSWALYDYKKTELQKEKVSFLNQVTLKNIKSFRIIQANKSLSVVQENNEWLLKKPVQDLASFTEISRWLDELKNIKVKKIHVEKEELLDWKTYHLGKIPRVEIDLSSGNSISFSLSKKSSFDGKYFIKKEEELFLGDSHFSSEINTKNFDDFRSKRLLPSLGHAVKFQFIGIQNFTLKWADYKWSLQKSKSVPLDSNRLDGFWTDINSIKAISIKEALSPISINKYKLNKPQLKITFHYPNQQTYVMKISPFQKEKAFVFLSHRNFIFEISKEDAKKIILTQDEIRDHNFPFNYNLLMAAQINKKSQKSNWSIKKINKVWQSINEKKSAVNPKKVEELLNKIKNLRAEKYKFDSTKHNLRSIQIKNANQKNIFELKEVFQSENYSWLKTNLWDELVAVPKNSINEIFNIELFISSEIKKKNSK